MIWPRTPVVDAAAPVPASAPGPGGCAAPGGHGNRGANGSSPIGANGGATTGDAGDAGFGFPDPARRLVVAVPGEDHLEPDGDEDQRQEVDQVEAEDAQVAQEEGGADEQPRQPDPPLADLAPLDDVGVVPASIGMSGQNRITSPNSTNPRLSRVRTTPRSASDTPMAMCGVISTGRGGVIVNIRLPALRATPPADGPLPGPRPEDHLEDRRESTRRRAGHTVGGDVRRVHMASTAKTAAAPATTPRTASPALSR